MYIRQEQPEDYEEIYKLVKIAFETAAVKDGDEQDYVAELRNGSCYIPDLALVAVEGNILIGHIMLTGTELISGEECHGELVLSPLSVALQHRKQGIGGALITECLRIAREKGYSAVFLCGDPEYYKRYGFRSASDFGIRNAGNLPQRYVMTYELYPNALKNKAGSINIV